jgi:hypothetical protein
MPMTVDTLTQLAGELKQITDGHVPDAPEAPAPSDAVRDWAKRWLMSLMILGVDLPHERVRRIPRS